METSQIIGLVIVLVLVVLGFVFTIWKSKKHTLAKLIGILIFAAIALTWVFTYGYYNGANFADYNMHRQGLTDLPNMVYYAMSFAADKIIFLLALGAFYAVLSKCKGYNKLVNVIAKAFKGIEVIFILISSLLITAMASLFSQSFIPLIFIPFLISIILAMKLDKITAFAATFGSILIGTIGVTYGGEGFYWFNYYVGTEATTAILYRLIVLVVAFILFNFFTCLHAKNVLEKKNVNELEADPFKMEELKKDEKCHVWPYIVLMAFLLIICVLGYINWEANFGITCFNTFHEKLMGLKIGEFAPFLEIVGTLANTVAKGAFGNWNLYHASTILIVLTLVIALIKRMKLDDFISSCGEGLKKMALPTILFVGAYLVMTGAYMSPFIPTITNTIFKHVSTFNPYLVSLDALLANIFHIDFGFTGYVVAGYFTSTYAANLEVIHTIFTTLYGFIGFFAPTSAILVIGLTYLDIDYKTWMKYSWMFIVAMLVILLVLFTIMTYI